MAYTPEELAQAFDSYQQAPQPAQQQQSMYSPQDLSAAFDAYQHDQSLGNLDESFGGRFKNNLVAAANAAFPFADEGAAAVRAYAPTWLGGNSSGANYDQELAAIRGGEKDYATVHPYQSGASSVVGIGATAPLMPSGIAGRATLAGKAGQAALEGAAYGGFQGFGSAEGGLDERLQRAEQDAVISGILSPAIVGALGGAGKLLGSTADKIRPASAEDEAIQLLKPTAADFRKAARFKGDAGDQALNDAIEGARARGVFGAGPDIGAIAAKNDEVMSSLGSQADDLLKAADSSGKGAPALTFDNAYKFIADHPFDEAKLADQFKRRMDVIGEKWDGTVAGLNQLKRQIGKSAFLSEADSKAFDRVLYSDLRATVERGADMAGEGTGKAVRDINKQLGQHYDIADLIEKASNRGAAAELRAPKSFGITSTPALLSGGALASLLSGDLTGLALTGGAALGKKIINSKTAANGAAGILDALSSASGSAASLGDPRLARMAGELWTPDQGQDPGQMPTQSQEAGGGGISPQQAAQLQQPRQQAAQLDVLNPSPNSAPSSHVNQVFDALSNAVKHVESRGNANAESSKGAIGTHQVTPIAARDVLRAQGVDDRQYSDSELKQILRQPGMSQQFGEAYLQLLIQRYDGNVELALAAYNGGPSRLDEVGRDISKMPAETRNYVPAVFEALTRGQA